MLEHPWIANVMQHKVDMAYWMRKVWGWPKVKKSGERFVDASVECLQWLNTKFTSTSRPSSSRSDHPSLDASMASLSIASEA